MHNHAALAPLFPILRILLLLFCLVLPTTSSYPTLHILPSPSVSSNYPSSPPGVDSGYDLFFPRDVTIEAGCFGKIVDLEVRIRYEKEGRGSAIWLLPRSSITKSSVRMSNGMGELRNRTRLNFFCLFPSCIDLLTYPSSVVDGWVH